MVAGHVLAYNRYIITGTTRICISAGKLVS